MKDKLKWLRRYWPIALLIALPIGITWSSIRMTLRVQDRRAEYERYLNRALESCLSGNTSGAYNLLLRAHAFAPTEAEEDVTRELMPKFRAGNCDLPSAPRSGDLELGAMMSP